MIVSAISDLSKRRKSMRKYHFLSAFVATLCMLGILISSVSLFAEPEPDSRAGSEQATETNETVSDYHSVVREIRNELGAKSTSVLVESLGTGAHLFRMEVMIEIGKRFDASAPPEREKMIRSLNAILETSPERERRFDAVSRLGGFVNFKPTPGEMEQIAEGLRRAIATDREPGVVLLAVRNLPDFDQSNKGIDALLSVLDNQELLNKEPDLRTMTFLSFGRVGASAIPFLVNFLEDFPEQVLMGLSFTKNSVALEIIEESSRSKDSQVRYHAVHALGLYLYGSIRGVSVEEKRIVKKALLRALHDADKDVRKKAAEWIGELTKAR